VSNGVTVVDAHAHVIVPGMGAEVGWDERGQVVHHDGRSVRAAVREFSDLERILEEQDRAGVDVVILAPWVNLCGVKVERQNDLLAGLVGKRVAALGTVDLSRPDQLLELMRDGRLSGVEIPATAGGRYLGDDQFRDFWAAADESDALVFIHPSTRGFGLPVLDEHYLWNTIGNPVETAMTAAHMIAAGVLDELPNLRVLLAHGGGALPWLRGRLAHEQLIHGPGRDVRAAIGRFYVDSVVHDSSVLHGLVDFFGTDRVLLGSDYPFDMGVERPGESVRVLGLAPDDEAAILGGNALRLIRSEAE
jgi:aminocarboxymuconate-semialdehyde decarboxylase